MTHADILVLNVTGSCSTVSFPVLESLLQMLPDLRVEGEGKLSIPHLKFEGHVAIMLIGYPRARHAFEFTFGGRLDEKPYIIRITADSTFFSLRPSKRAEIITQLKPLPIRWGSISPVEWKSEGNPALN